MKPVDWLLLMSKMVLMVIDIIQLIPLQKYSIIRLFQSYGLALPEIREYFTGSTDLISLVHRLEAIRDRLNDNINSLYERIATSDIKISQITVPAQTVCAKKKGIR